MTITKEHDFFGLSCTFCGASPAPREQGALSSAFADKWRNFIRVNTCDECFALTRCTTHTDLRQRRSFIKTRALECAMALDREAARLGEADAEKLDYLTSRRERILWILDHITNHGSLTFPPEGAFADRLGRLQEMIDRWEQRTALARNPAEVDPLLSRIALKNEASTKKRIYREGLRQNYTRPLVLQGENGEELVAEPEPEVPLAGDRIF